MDAPLRLVIFDVDGTLVDSQAVIVACMKTAFSEVGLAAPERADILGGVGLSLHMLMPLLAPNASAAAHEALSTAYKSAFMAHREETGVAASSPLYPGALECLNALHDVPDVLLGVATGKSKRGLDKLLEAFDLAPKFVTQQVADFHPSKPHPAMILSALQETGVDAQHAVMVGDTSFDMDMAANAGVRSVGVMWGYHGRDRLGRATRTVDNFQALPDVLNEMWENKQ
ncbi:HAD-IA family hydrolase [Ascidiaceihabitans sp.]|uniref:HAD-IA family hydrolase n=1 Tax=Ascidiaceihabitans sp. TaxID=1872644 RepID=UPI003298BBFA